MNLLLGSIQAASGFSGTSPTISELAVAMLLLCSFLVAWLLGIGSR